MFRLKKLQDPLFVVSGQNLKSSGRGAQVIGEHEWEYLLVVDNQEGKKSKSAKKCRSNWG
jgi:hypothetical protein